MSGRPLKRFHNHHFRMAYLLARGDSLSEVAAATGTTYHRVSTLSKDPQFKKVLDHLSKRLEDHAVAEFSTIQQMRKTNLEMALAELQARLEEHPDTFSNRDLTEVIGDASDRLEMGRTQKHVHGHIDLASNLAIARQRRLALSASGSPPSDEGAERHGAAPPIIDHE